MVTLSHLALLKLQCSGLYPVGKLLGRYTSVHPREKIFTYEYTCQCSYDNKDYNANDDIDKKIILITILVILILTGIMLLLVMMMMLILYIISKIIIMIIGDYFNLLLIFLFSAQII